MAKIPLRAYVREIENYIERGEIDPAIAHAKNILKTYPKHIDTYRLLGKAFLESQRYTQALDILQRVLSVIPDDFISQIGMSIIREDEGNLDQAIWHMERAYEVQPFNPAVQDELRRLYGRRDGIQPPKIRLTRGALVRMYARGELYPQAIAETLAAMAEDPQRTDLEVLLARLYFLSKQKIEAIEACSRLLKRLPYCKEAIEILTRVLPETNRASDAPYYLQRLYTLEPYAAFTSPNAPTSDQVPEQAVMVEKFNLDMSMAEVQTPEWTQNIGVQWEEPEAEDLPDWLNTLKPAQDSAVGVAAFGAAEAITPADDTNLLPDQQFPPQSAHPADELMPDFLKDAGWTQSDRRADDIMKESLMQESGEDEAAAPAEIPDWLQSIAPQQGGTGVPEEEERTDWLDSLLPSSEGANGKGEPAGQVETPMMVDGLDDDLAEADLPDWLAGMGQETDKTSTPEAFASDVPDWMSATGPGSAADDQPKADQPLDWLSEMGQPAQPAAESGEAPDWIASLAEPEQETAAPAGDMPDWLKGLEQHPNDTQMLDLGESASDLPEFAAPQIDQPAAEVQPAAESLPTADVPGMPDWLQALETGQEQAPEDLLAAQEQPAAQDSTGWMAALSEDTPLEQELAEGEADGAFGALAADIPDWMQGLAPSDEEQAEAKSTLFDAPIEETPEAPSAEAAPAAEMPDMNDMDATMAWLESLAAKQGADEATLLITSPDQRTDIAPDWLQQQSTEPAAEEVQPTAVEAEQTQPADIPDWLAELSPAAQEETVSAVEGVEEFIPGREQEMVETDLPTEEALPTAEITELETATMEQAAEEPVSAVAEEPISPVAEEPTAAMANQMADAGAELAQPDFSDTDATMAWLEALAARQGADEATLITPPDQRTETPPDWVQQAAEDQPAAELPSEELEMQEQPAAEADAAQAADLPDWLQGLEQPTAGETAAQAVDADAGFARIFEEPQRGEEPLAEEAVWPVDSYAGDEIAQESAADILPAAEEMPVAETPQAAEVQPVEPTAEAAAAGEMPDLSDMDAAMAWLESLAAKQGADEATLLISNPDQRSETPPDWVQKQTAEVDQAEQPLDEIPELSDIAVQPETEPAADLLPAAELTPAAEELPAVEAELPDWLASLEQPVGQEADAVWPVDSFQGEAIAQEAAAQDIVEATIEGEPPTAEAAEAQAPAGMPDMNDMDATMAWLEALAAKQGADEATLLISTPDQRSETPPEWVRKQTGELKLPEETVETQLAQAGDMPDWLQEAESEETAPAEKTQPVAAVPSAVSAEPSVTDETAAWLESLNTAEEEIRTSEHQAETPESTQPGGELMPQWLTSLEEESEVVEYASAEEETAAVPVDISSAWVPEETAPEPVGQQSTEAAPALLSLPELQSALRRGDLDRALEGYSQLISSGQMLDETIHDLRDALYRYPVDIMIWQTLGDAYSRNNQLQEALDAYTKAEELLR